MKDNLYIVKSYGKGNECLIKFGYSTNIEKRLKHYKRHNPLIDILHTFYREDALEFEKWFHRTNNAIFNQEWYHIDILDYLINNINNTYKNYEERFEYKICNKCKIRKHKSEYHKSEYRADKMHYYCKLCGNTITKINKLKRLEKDEIY